MKQKISIKVDMIREKSRVKTMQIAATATGVVSVSMKDDTVTVEGNDVDSVTLTCKLRKKVGKATLIGVEEVKEKKKEDAGGGDKKPPGITTTYYQYPYPGFLPPPATYYGHY